MAIPICALAATSRTTGLVAFAPLLAATLPFFGVVLGFWWTRRLQIAADRRARLQHEASSRSIVYAQLRRIHKTTRQQLRFVEGPDKMIWLTIHRSLFPAVENLTRLEPLTASEVDAITSFYYLYQEQVSFLAASAMEVWAPELRGTMDAKFNLEADVIGFDYANPARKDSMVYRLTNIRRSVEKALAAIRSAIAERSEVFPELHKLALLEAEKLAARP